MTFDEYMADTLIDALAEAGLASDLGEHEAAIGHALANAARAWDELSRYTEPIIGGAHHPDDVAKIRLLEWQLADARGDAAAWRRGAADRLGVEPRDIALDFRGKIERARV